VGVRDIVFKRKQPIPQRKGKEATNPKVTLYLEEVHDFWSGESPKLTINVAEVHQQVRQHHETTRDAAATVRLMLDIVDKGFDLATATEGIDLGVFTELGSLLSDALSIVELPENRDLIPGLSIRKMGEMIETLEEMGERG
jgi:hypothetical protein